MKKAISILLCLMTLCACVPAMATDVASEPFVSCPAVEYTGDISALAWAEYLEEGDVVGEPNPDALEYYAKYMELYDDFVYVNENTEVGDLNYYVYDPVAHGFDPNEAYPVSIWFHGGGNNTLGKLAMVAGGAASFACDEYQQEIGGMYIIVPIAGPGGWNVGTVNAIKGMLDNVKASHRTTDELIVCGTSAGGMMVNNWLEQYAYMTDIVFQMSCYLPTIATIQKYSDMGIQMWYEVALHDYAYDLRFPDGLGIEGYDGIENFSYTVFEWIRWGNGMIATLGPNDSIDGQHCSCVQVLRNLIQDDGTPDDPTHPDGVTGYFRDALAKIREAE